MPKKNTIHIKLTDDRRVEMLRLIKIYYREEFEENMSDFRAEGMLKFFIETLGHPVYNQAIQDARAFISERLDDLDATFHEQE